MILALAITDQIGLGTIILAVIGIIVAIPASILAWRSLQDRETQREDTEKRKKNEELLVELLTQVKSPRDDKTLGEMFDDQRDDMEDLTRGMAEIATLLVGHVSDGHGGQEDKDYPRFPTPPRRRPIKTTRKSVKDS